MLRIPNLFYLSVRGVRSNNPHLNNPPYPFFFKSLGWRECGPYYEEIWEWPARDSGWSVLPPSVTQKPVPTFIDDAKSQKTGYPDPVTNKFVTVDDAKPELMVPPDMEGFKLKPYVSFRTPETEADAPPLTPKDLFDIFYADRVDKWFSDGKYTGNVDSLLEQEIGDEATRKRALREKGLPVLDDGNQSVLS